MPLRTGCAPSHNHFFYIINIARTLTSIQHIDIGIDIHTAGIAASRDKQAIGQAQYNIATRVHHRGNSARHNACWSHSDINKTEYVCFPGQSESWSSFLDSFDWCSGEPLGRYGPPPSHQPPTTPLELIALDSSVKVPVHELCLIYPIDTTDRFTFNPAAEEFVPTTTAFTTHARLEHILGRADIPRKSLPGTMVSENLPHLETPLVYRLILLTDLDDLQETVQFDTATTAWESELAAEDGLNDGSSWSSSGSLAIAASQQIFETSAMSSQCDLHIVAINDEVRVVGLPNHRLNCLYCHIIGPSMIANEIGAST